MKWLTALLFLCPAAAWAQFPPAVVGNRPTRVSDHVQTIMGFPNIVISRSSRSAASKCSTCSAGSRRNSAMRLRVSMAFGAPTSRFRMTSRSILVE